MKILALDLGSSCGWAIAEPGRLAAAGMWAFPETRQGEALIDRHGRLGDLFADWLPRLIREHRPEFVVMEKVLAHKTGAASRELLLGMRMLTLTVCTRWQLMVEEAHLSTWQAWARRHHGWTKIKGNDANDAQAIAAWWFVVRLPELRIGQPQARSDG